MQDQTTTADLLSVDDAAAYLGVKPQTLAVWRSTHRYGLPYVKLGRLVRYSRRALDQWIESRTFGEPAEAV